MEAIIVAIISGIVAIVIAVIAYLKEVKMKAMQAEIDRIKEEAKQRALDHEAQTIKLGALDRMMDFQSFQEIRDSVDRMFEHTKADRFMLLFAMNGTHDFRVVSVIFEQHKETKWKVNALIRYRNVEIDQEFRKILKDAESEGEMDYEVKNMNPQLLRDMWVLEKIKHAKVRFLHREKIDKHNDIVIFSTIATHEEESFTQLEDTYLKTEFEGSIVHTLQTYI